MILFVACGLHSCRTEQGFDSGQRREFQIDMRYLNLPVKNGAPKRLVSLIVDDTMVRQFEIELADAEADWWAFIDLLPFDGRSAILEIDESPENSQGLASIVLDDEIIGAEDLYKEKLRPQFHFSSRRGWNNDPNGLVYYDGEYHLFYQHNPFGWEWGNMHWGHAVSPDLVHWTEIGEALHPDTMGTMFSGSAVVDHYGTAGIGQGPEKTLIAFYTAAGGTNPQSAGQSFTQCFAYSEDRGRTWTKYPKNPVLKEIVEGNRDPKVIWHEPEEKWVMALYLDENNFSLFESFNLKYWTRLSDLELPGAIECPEFFEIPVDGGIEETRWVFYGGNGLYLIGEFDGNRFTSETAPLPLNFGNCFYASQTFNGIPPEDGRRILMPWGQMAAPGMPFNQMIGLPVELTLRKTSKGLRLFAYPVRELESLRARQLPIKPQAIGREDNPLDGFELELFDLLITFNPVEAESVEFTVRGVPVIYDAGKRELRCLDRKASLSPVDGLVRLRMLVDRTTIDLFANDGEIYMPMGVTFEEGNTSIKLSTVGGVAEIHDIELHELKSAWE